MPQTKELEQKWNLVLCTLDNEERCAQLIAEGFNVNGVVGHATRPLSQAAGRGQIKICKALIAGGADVNYDGEGGRTALHFAGANGHVEIVELLIDAGANVKAHTVDDWGTPLHWSAGRPQVVEILLAAGADVHAVCKGGQTPLWEAVYMQDMEACKLLLAAGADPTVRPSNHPVDYLSPLEKAVLRGNAALFQLLSRGRDIDLYAPSAGGFILRELAEQSGDKDMIELMRSLYCARDISDACADGPASDEKLEAPLRRSASMSPM